MERNVSRVVRFGAGLVGLITLGWILTGQAAKPAPEGLPTDWTHRHVIFSQPATSEEAWRVAGDVRYWQQWHRQHVPRVVSADTEGLAVANVGQAEVVAESEMQGLWSETLGAGGTVGADNFPAKYSFSTSTANCANATTPDFAVFSTGLAGSGTQASIIAYDNLYSGCPTTTVPVPSVYWAYNTGGQILTSPVFSRSGSQVAFVQTNAGAASLVLLTWAGSTGESVGKPGTISSEPVGSYVGCTAPCFTTLALTSGTGTATNDTTSSIYYDYIGDTAWVGDASGWLHQFTPVFNGTSTKPPAEVRTSPWPFQVNPAAPKALTSPVHDPVSGNVFVEDQGGILYSVSVSNGTVVASGQVDHGVVPGGGGPILDRTAEEVYLFSSSDGSDNCAGTACSAVYQFPAKFTHATTPAEVTVGTSSATPNSLYDGSFDSEFYSSPTRTGNLYVCGDTGVNPILYRVPMTTGNFGTAESVAPLTAAADHRACSPVTDVLNRNGSGGAEERAFFSVIDNGHPTACGNAGCAMSFITTQWQAGTAYQVGQEILIFRTENDTHYINVAIGAGTSGTTAPAWSNTAGATATDGTVTWMNQGATQVTAMNAWVANHAYGKGNRIFDGANVEVVTTAGTSGGTVPTNWATTAGGTTSEGPSVPQLTWTNAGALPSSALEATGGTSGIIIDNIVSTTTLAGASELYFSTLGNEACPTTSTGCAVQASQAALK